ncbi:NAD(P)/FAD-dependent oxidoreductase [Ignavibacteria bacterium]|nr:NAD(P)/FAD-dependent oxidoreductase [Bacteroidota bacterium]MCZ2133489.1 NAD(P)/FAD-dependent oxidoreductase [Bacteroidota bacterium]
MTETIQTDVAIIGAGPVGLFAVFEAGLLKLHCHLMDYLPIPGGQCAEIYPKKPIYDIPGFPSVLACDLIHNLMEQIKPFKPTFTLGERVEKVSKTDEGKFLVETNRGTRVIAPIVCIAGGLGCFEPRKPDIANLADYEYKGIDYIIKEPAIFRNKNVIIAGGGDSALDWTIVLADIAANVTLVHRRKEFRGAPDSVEKVRKLVEDGKVKLFTDAQITELHGDGKLEGVTISVDEGDSHRVETDYFIPLFGLSPKLGPIAEWGLNIDKNAVEVNPITLATNIPGIFAIGDVCTYEGKLKLILCGFHEGAMMAQAAYKILFPNKRSVLKYTTVTGITSL